MEDNYIINGKVYSASQVYENALHQRDQGVQPSYRYNFGKGDYSDPGYLVWSTWDNGAGVCIVNEKYSRGYCILTGWQGEFIVKP